MSEILIGDDELNKFGDEEFFKNLGEQLSNKTAFISYLSALSKDNYIEQDPNLDKSLKLISSIPNYINRLLHNLLRFKEQWPKREAASKEYDKHKSKSAFRKLKSISSTIENIDAMILKDILVAHDEFNQLFKLIRGVEILNTPINKIAENEIESITYLEKLKDIKIIFSEREFLNFIKFNQFRNSYIHNAYFHKTHLFYNNIDRFIKLITELKEINTEYRLIYKKIILLEINYDFAKGIINENLSKNKR